MSSASEPPDPCDDPSPLGEVLKGHSLEQAAYHESGHAYIEKLLEAEVRCVRVIPAQDGFIGITVSRCPPRLGRTSAMVALAGVVAQWIIDGVGRKEGGFLHWAREMLSGPARLDMQVATVGLGLSGDELTTEVDGMLEKIRSVLVDDQVARASIERVARALINQPDHRLLDADLRALIPPDG